MAYGSNLFSAYYNSRKLPTDGLLFYSPLDKARDTLSTGQTVHVAKNGDIVYANIDGIDCATLSNDRFIIYAPQTTGFPTGRAVRSVSFWYRLMNTTDSRECIAICYGVNNTHKRWTVGLSDDGLYVAAARNTALANFTVDTLWHCMVANYNGTAIDWYKDGLFYVNATFPSPASVNTGDSLGVAVGANINTYAGTAVTAHSKTSYLAAVRLYNRTLSQPEISALATEFNPTIQ